MPTYLITGGAGFIGSHIVERLIGEGHRVVVIDNLVTSSIDNVEKVLDEPRFEFFETDCTEPYKIREPVDYVLHLASPASPVDFTKLPFEILKAGSGGTFRACELAIKKNARLLFASTSEVYGDPDVHPQSEDYCGNVKTMGPRAVYDEAKRFGEATVSAYRRYRNLDARIVRIFNTYGPRMRPGDGRMIPNFITQALAGEPLTVYGEGEQTRSLCYVSDMVEGILRLLYSDFTGPVNIGNPDELSVNEIAELIISKINPELVTVAEPLPEDDPKRRQPDITLAREVLGWDIKVTLDEGLAKTIDWFREHITTSV
jgi:dTDP-glucose 4,6-dehydratase